MDSEIDIHSPVNSIYIIQDKLIVACGGGPGLKNKLILYQLNLGNIGDILIDNIIEKTPKFIEGKILNKIGIELIKGIGNIETKIYISSLHSRIYLLVKARASDQICRA